MASVQANLSEQQRGMPTSALSLKGIKLPAYTFELAKECIVELFCEPRSSLENPAYRVSGETEGWSGYWVECEETGEEGFIAELDDGFWNSRHVL